MEHENGVLQRRSTSPRPALPKLEGYLEKRGAKGPLGKSFKKRWFQLQGPKLYYFRARSDPLSANLGYIDLLAASDISPSKTTTTVRNTNFEFTITTPNRVYILMAPSEREMYHWIEGLRTARDTLLQQKGISLPINEAELPQRADRTRSVTYVASDSSRSIDSDKRCSDSVASSITRPTTIPSAPGTTAESPSTSSTSTSNNNSFSSAEGELTMLKGVVESELRTLQEKHRMTEAELVHLREEIATASHRLKEYEMAHMKELEQVLAAAEEREKELQMQLAATTAELAEKSSQISSLQSRLVEAECRVQEQAQSPRPNSTNTNEFLELQRELISTLETLRDKEQQIALLTAIQKAQEDKQRAADELLKEKVHEIENWKAKYRGVEAELAASKVQLQDQIARCDQLVAAKLEAAMRAATAKLTDAPADTAEPNAPANAQSDKQATEAEQSPTATPSLTTEKAATVGGIPVKIIGGGDMPQRKRKVKVKALYNFTARTANELSFHAGDQLLVHDQDPSGWWKGELIATGELGLFPFNYCSVVEVLDEAVTTSTQRLKASQANIKASILALQKRCGFVREATKVEELQRQIEVRSDLLRKQSALVDQLNAMAVPYGVAGPGGRPTNNQPQSNKPPREAVRLTHATRSRPLGPKGRKLASVRVKGTVTVTDLDSQLDDMEQAAAELEKAIAAQSTPSVEQATLSTRQASEATPADTVEREPTPTTTTPTSTVAQTTAITTTENNEQTSTELVVDKPAVSDGVDSESVSTKPTVENPAISDDVDSEVETPRQDSDVETPRQDSEQKLASLQREIDDLTTNQRELEEEIADLNKQLKDAVEARMVAEQRLADMSAERDALQKQLSAKEEEIVVLRANRTSEQVDHDKELTKMVERFRAIQEELEKEIGELRRELAAKDEHITVLKETQAYIEEMQKVTEELLRQQGTKVAELQSRLDETEEALANTRARLRKRDEEYMKLATKLDMAASDEPPSDVPATATTTPTPTPASQLEDREQPSTRPRSSRVPTQEPSASDGLQTESPSRTPPPLPQQSTSVTQPPPPLPDAATVPELPLWVPDISAPVCFDCRRTFTTFKRRHHCRNCGHVFCSSCAHKRIAIPEFGYFNPVRVCENCFVRIQAGV